MDPLTIGNLKSVLSKDCVHYCIVICNNEYNRWIEYSGYINKIPKYLFKYVITKLYLGKYIDIECNTGLRYQVDLERRNKSL